MYIKGNEFLGILWMLLGMGTFLIWLSKDIILNKKQFKIILIVFYIIMGSIGYVVLTPTVLVNECHSHTYKYSNPKREYHGFRSHLNWDEERLEYTCDCLIYNWWGLFTTTNYNSDGSLKGRFK